MSPGLIIVLVLVAAAGIGGMARAWWCRRNPAPLRGDWWTDFERDFRRWAASRPQPRRRSSRRDSQ